MNSLVRLQRKEVGTEAERQTRSIPVRTGSLALRSFNLKLSKLTLSYVPLSTAADLCFSALHSLMYAACSTSSDSSYPLALVPTLM